MGRSSGKRYGGKTQMGDVKRSAYKAGRGEGLSRDRRKKARQEARAAKKAKKKALKKMRLEEEKRMKNKRKRNDQADSDSEAESQVESEVEEASDQVKLAREKLKKQFGQVNEDDDNDDNKNTINNKKNKKNKKKRKVNHDDDDKEDIDEKVRRELRKQQQLKDIKEREGFARKKELKQKIKRSSLLSSIEADEERLKCWYPGKEEHLAKLKAEEDKYDPDRRRGPAKPAEEAYPWLYPDYHEKKEREKLEAEERELRKGDNIIEKYTGHYGQHQETRKLLAKKLDLALVSLEMTNDKFIKQGLGQLQSIEKMDKDGFLGSRLVWLLVASYIDQGDLDGANEAIESYFEIQDSNNNNNNNNKARTSHENSNDDEMKNDTRKDPFEAMLKWDLVLILYISFFELETPGIKQSDIDKAIKDAVASNPLIPYVLLQEVFQATVDVEVVDSVVEGEQNRALQKFINDDEPKKVQVPRWSLEEVAIIYFVRATSWWKDADGVDEFLRDRVYRDGNVKELLQNHMKSVETQQTRRRKIDRMFDAVWNRTF